MLGLIKSQKNLEPSTSLFKCLIASTGNVKVQVREDVQRAQYSIRLAQRIWDLNLCIKIYVCLLLIKSDNIPDHTFT